MVLLSTICCHRVPDVAPLTHRSPVAVRPGPALVDPTVRLRRRFTSDTAGYWVQLFTLGSVTALSSNHTSRPVHRLVGQAAAFDAAIDFFALTACGRAGQVGRNVDGDSSVPFVSPNSSVHVLVGLTRVSGVLSERTTYSQIVVLFFYWRQYSLVD